MTFKKTALVALILTACTFGASTALVPHGDIDHAQAAAMNLNQTHIFVGELFGDLVTANPSTGAEIDRLFLGEDQAVLRLVTNRADLDSVWALHASGFVVKWSENLVFQAFRPARPMGNVSSRQYCDFDVDEAGNMYMTSVDTFGGVDLAILARWDAGLNSWSSRTIAGTECVPLSYDEFEGEVVTIQGFTMRSYDDDLVDLGGHSLDSAAWCAEIHDIDALYGRVLAGGMCWSTDPHSKLWLFRSDGSLEDAEVAETEWINSVQLTYGPSGGNYAALEAGYDWNHVVTKTALQ